MEESVSHCFKSRSTDFLLNIHGLHISDLLRPAETPSALVFFYHYLKTESEESSAWRKYSEDHCKLSLWPADLTMATSVWLSCLKRQNQQPL